jgi:hypothetical protein
MYVCMYVYLYDIHIFLHMYICMYMYVHVVERHGAEGPLANLFTKTLSRYMRSLSGIF